MFPRWLKGWFELERKYIPLKKHKNWKNLNQTLLILIQTKNLFYIKLSILSLESLEKYTEVKSNKIRQTRVFLFRFLLFLFFNVTSWRFLVCRLSNESTAQLSGSTITATNDSSLITIRLKKNNIKKIKEARVPLGPWHSSQTTLFAMLIVFHGVSWTNWKYLSSFFPWVISVYSHLKYTRKEWSRRLTQPDAVKSKRSRNDPGLLCIARRKNANLLPSNNRGVLFF